MSTTTRARRAALVAAFTILAADAAGAQSPAEWIKRILDPGTIGVTPAPGTTLNRKLTVDYLGKVDPPAKMAVYMAPLDQLPAVSKHFQDTLKVKPAITGAGGEFETHRFELTGEGDYPKQAEGLVIMITKSPWVDNKQQITMQYTPK
jgi:hypothetical protein